MTTDPLVIDPAERRGCMVGPVLAVTETTLPELAPRRRRRRYTLPAPVVVAAAPGQPGDPTRCTCDPRRWRGVSAGRVRHEPTCPRSLASLRSNSPR